MQQVEHFTPVILGRSIELLFPSIDNGARPQDGWLGRRHDRQGRKLRRNMGLGAYPE